MAQKNEKPASETHAADAPEETIHLDGRTLEGGGQLVRNAVALSALTGRPITISNIRGNRQGKTGLKGSHAAAIQFISEICQGEVINGQVGSQTMTLYPRKRSLYHDPAKARVESSIASVPLQLRFSSLGLPVVKPEYTIQQHTAGSISLVFQALYPYLVYASSLSMTGGTTKPIQVHITGGTNVTFSPSFDYLHQVLVPNLLKCGLPRLSINLHKRGWSTGPRDLGAVTFYINPLEKIARGKNGWFPALNLGQYRRTVVTSVDITILAPDIDLEHQEAQGKQARRKAGRKHERRGNSSGHSNDNSSYSFRSTTAREYLEDKVQKSLRKTMASGIVAETREDGERSEPEEFESRVPIQIRLSEATHHHTHIYILLVAHLSNGFTLGSDALFNGYAKHGDRKHDRGKAEKDSPDGSNNMIMTLDELVDNCIARLVEEVRGRGDSDGTTHQPCVDVHMRDQLVIFEALGLLSPSTDSAKEDDKLQRDYKEDERYWSLHTQTARWVCEQILGEDVWRGT